MSDAGSPIIRRVRWYSVAVPYLTGVIVSFAGFFSFSVWYTLGGAASPEDAIAWVVGDFLANTTLLILTNLVLLGLSWWFLSRINDPDLPAGFKMPTPAAAKLGLAAGLGIAIVSALFEYLCDLFLHTSLMELSASMPFMPRNTSQLPLGVFCVVLVVPLAEEAMYRGLLGGWFQRHWGRQPAIFGSAFIFAMVHLWWLQSGGLTGWLITLEIFAMGCVLAFVAFRTGTLWASFLTHAVVNLGALTLVFLQLPPVA